MRPNTALPRCGQAAPQFIAGLKPASTRRVGGPPDALIGRWRCAIIEGGSEHNRTQQASPAEATPALDRGAYQAPPPLPPRLRAQVPQAGAARGRGDPKRVLHGAVATRLDELLRQACEVNGWGLRELNVQQDHVHLLVQVAPSQSVSCVVKILKGGTSRVLRAEFPELEEFLWGKQFWANFWARGFFAETMGKVEEATVQAYIREQRP